MTFNFTNNCDLKFDLKSPVLETSLPYPRRQGKVRDVYDLGETLLIVSSDRISAFDWILPNAIPGKGIVLTQLSRFWFEQLDVAHHLIATDPPTDLQLSEEQRRLLAGRSMVTHKARVVPYECVVRGYLEGSGWREYQQTGEICGVRLPAGLKQCDQLPEPIFTPATKAEQGHDENVSFQTMADDIGLEVASQLRDLSLDVYQQGSAVAFRKGIIIADTKLEWGWRAGKLILIDEVLTPDSSRFWPAADYAPGHSQPSLDKQYVREWLSSCGWDRSSPPPPLPGEVVDQTSRKYASVLELLTAS